MLRNTAREIAVHLAYELSFTALPVEELLRLQHLVQSDDRRIATTVSGAQIGDELSVRIPYTLRERSVKAALRLLRRRSIEKDNTVTVDRSPDGARLVTCAVQDCGKTLFSVTLRGATPTKKKRYARTSSTTLHCCTAVRWPC